MDQREKNLYQQIHPVKLLADWLPGIATIPLMWKHRWRGTVLSIIPGMIVSVVLVKAVEMEPIKRSAAGHYIKEYMTPQMQALRLMGQFVIWWGAWIRKPWIIVAGFAMILYGWFNGVIAPKKQT